MWFRDAVSSHDLDWSIIGIMKAGAGAKIITRAVTLITAKTALLYLMSKILARIKIWRFGNFFSDA